MTHWLPDIRGRTGPRYRAIAEAIADDIQAGRLSVGTRLPTHRDLAWRLGVTVGTVTRAYKEVTARGLVDGEIGRGTFVRDPRTHGWGRNSDSDPAPVDMGLNFPTEMAETETALKATLAEIVADPRDLRLASYDINGGRREHRAAIAHWMAGGGVAATADTTLISAGAQHAIATALQALTEPGDVVLCDPLTHPGFIGCASTLRLRTVGVEWDGSGMAPDALDAAIRHHRPKALFIIPTVHNPTSLTFVEGRRRDLARVIAHHGLPVVEDDLYRSYADADVPPPLAAFAPDQVIYLTSASKHLSPGLRVGALHMPPRLRARGRAAIRDTIWMAAPLSVEVIVRWLADGTADRLAESKRRAQKARAAEARRLLGPLVAIHAEASPHAWLRVPDTWGGSDPAAALLERGVVTTSGEVFATTPGAGRGRIRLALGRPERHDDTVAGLQIVAETLLRGPAEDRAFM
ncbi:MAG: PLP-dependent aminotransferase family protein [Thalassobaculaceae bacterium]|nr:PLP-dependent aminotransferase family protein [Thalassobaculaceae bacterium]